MSHFQEIENYVNSLKVLDTHEHLMEESERLKLGSDPLVVFLPHYLSSDLVSSGMKLDELNILRSEDTPLEERWRSFMDHWVEVENTGYAQAIKIAARDLYGVEEFGVDSWRELGNAMKNFHNQGLYEHVLKKKSGIELSINDELPKGVKESWDTWILECCKAPLFIWVWDSLKDHYLPDLNKIIETNRYDK